MTKETLHAAVSAAKDETRAALQTVYDSLNQGQRKKLLKEPPVADLLSRYEVSL